MKILIVSDLHLGSHFSQKRFDYLKDLFTKADRIILNGDFWDLYTDTFEDFINSSWNGLFPILKKKKTIYIGGNHDYKAHTGKEVMQWSNKHVESYKFTSGKLTLHVEHGHRRLEKDSDNPTTRKATLHRAVKYHIWFRNPVEHWLIKHENDFFHRLYMNNNQKKLMKYAQTLPENHILVTGHTHLPTFKPENHFINTGYINDILAYYLWVEDGQLSFVKEYLP